MALEPGKKVCQGSHMKPDNSSNCPVCRKLVLVAQSNGGRVIAHTGE